MTPGTYAIFIGRQNFIYDSHTYFTLFLLSSQLKHENSKPQVGLQDFISLLTSIKESSFGIYANKKLDLASFYTTKAEIT